MVRSLGVPFSPVWLLLCFQSTVVPLYLQHTHSYVTKPTPCPGSPHTCSPSLSSLVHFLPTGQHCLLEEGEDEEDP